MCITLKYFSCIPTIRKLLLEIFWCQTRCKQSIHFTLWKHCSSIFLLPLLQIYYLCTCSSLIYKSVNLHITARYSLQFYQIFNINWNRPFFFVENVTFVTICIISGKSCKAGFTNVCNLTSHHAIEEDFWFLKWYCKTWWM